MVYFIVQCHGRAVMGSTDKGSIIAQLKSNEGETMKWIADQVELSRSISERFWRTLENPDIFWDDDLMKPMAWTEDKPGAKRQRGANIWPLWTTDDAIHWMHSCGHGLVSLYSFVDPEKAEVYLNYNQGETRKLVRVDAASVLLAFLTFIDRALKGGYDEK